MNETLISNAKITIESLDIQLKQFQLTYSMFNFGVIAYIDENEFLSEGDVVKLSFDSLGNTFEYYLTVMEILGIENKRKKVIMKHPFYNYISNNYSKQEKKMIFIDNSIPNIFLSIIDNNDLVRNFVGKFDKNISINFDIGLDSMKDMLEKLRKQYMTAIAFDNILNSISDEFYGFSVAVCGPFVDVYDITDDVKESVTIDTDMYSRKDKLFTTPSGISRQTVYYGSEGQYSVEFVDNIRESELGYAKSGKPIINKSLDYVRAYKLAKIEVLSSYINRDKITISSPALIGCIPGITEVNIGNDSFQLKELYIQYGSGGTVKGTLMKDNFEIVSLLKDLITMKTK